MGSDSAWAAEGQCLVERSGSACGSRFLQRGFNPAAQEDRALFKALLQGQHHRHGFRNADARAALYPATPSDPVTRLDGGGSHLAIDRPVRGGWTVNEPRWRPAFAGCSVAEYPELQAALAREPIRSIRPQGHSVSLLFATADGDPVLLALNADSRRLRSTLPPSCVSRSGSSAKCRLPTTRPIPRTAATLTFLSGRSRIGSKDCNPSTGSARSRKSSQ